MNWTSETPRKSGWYWLKYIINDIGETQKRIVHFSLYNGEILVSSAFGETNSRAELRRLISDFDFHRWAGPIPEPEEGVDESHLPSIYDIKGMVQVPEGKSAEDILEEQRKGWSSEVQSMEDV